MHAVSDAVATGHPCRSLIIEPASVRPQVNCKGKEYASDADIILVGICCCVLLFNTPTLTTTLTSMPSVGVQWPTPSVIHVNTYTGHELQWAKTFCVTGRSGPTLVHQAWDDRAVKVLCERVPAELSKADIVLKLREVFKPYGRVVRGASGSWPP